MLIKVSFSWQILCFLNYVFLGNIKFTLVVKKSTFDCLFSAKMKENSFLYQKNVNLFSLNRPFSRKSAFDTFQTIAEITVWNFLERLGKIISAPFVKVAISAVKIGGHWKPYISWKSGLSGSTSAEIGWFSTILS